MSEDRCVSCSDVVPEGRMVCPKCEMGAEQRLIDANALRQIFGGYTQTDSLGHTPMQLLDAMPTVDAVPVVHGRWIRPPGVCNVESSYRYQCTACGKTAHQVTGNCGKKIKTPHPKCTYEYCPNCGAMMDETNE